MSDLVGVDLNSNLEKTLVFEPQKTSVFLIGSANSFGGMNFHKQLSDVDLLYIPTCSSLRDYEKHLRQAIRLRETLNGERRDFADVFFLTQSIAPLHIQLLSVLLGANNLQNRTLFGSGLETYQKESMAIKKVQKKVYQAEALRRIRKCQNQLPVADTRKARATAKLINRSLKVIACALSNAENLSTTERMLFSTKDFDKIVKLLNSLTKRSLQVQEVIQQALDFKSVSDWPTWMIAQEEVVYWLSDVESKLVFNNSKESRFYDNIAEASRLLFVGLRHIFAESNKERRKKLVSEYIDEAATVVTRLGLAGIDELLDLSSSATPPLARESYDVIVEHLKEDIPSLKSLGAAITLLEFALERSVGRAIELNR